MTDFINGHAFSEVSTAAECRYECGWTWVERDMMDSNDWVFNPRYSIEFDTPYFPIPPMCPNGEDEADRKYNYEFYCKDGVEKHIVDGKEWEWPVGEFKPGVDENILETTHEWDKENRRLNAQMEANTNKLKREGTKKFSTNKGTEQAETCGEYEMTYWVDDKGKITVTQTSTWKGAPRVEEEEGMLIPVTAFLGGDHDHVCPLCVDDEVFKAAKRNCPKFLFGRPLMKAPPQLMFLDWVRRHEADISDIEYTRDHE